MAFARRIDEVREDEGAALHRAMLAFLDKRLHPQQEAEKLQLFTKVLQEHKDNPIAIKQLSRNDYSHLEDVLSLPFALNRDNTERATSKCLTLLQLWFEHVTDPELVSFLITHKKNQQTPTTFQLACIKGPKVFFAFLDLLTKLKNEKKITVAALVDVLQGRDQMGKNIFHTAADSGNVQLVEKLVQFTKSLMSNEAGDELIVALLNLTSNYNFIPRYQRFDNTHPVNALLLKLNPEEQKRVKEEENAAKQREEDLKRFSNLNKREFDLVKRENALIERERKIARHERFLESELAESNTRYDNLLEDYQGVTSAHNTYVNSLMKKIAHLKSYLDETINENEALKNNEDHLNRTLENQSHDLREKDMRINKLLHDLDYYQRELRESITREQDQSQRAYRSSDSREYSQHRFYQPDDRRDHERYAPLHPPGLFRR